MRREDSTIPALRLVMSTERSGVPLRLIKITPSFNGDTAVGAVGTEVR